VPAQFYNLKLKRSEENPKKFAFRKDRRAEFKKEAQMQMRVDSRTLEDN